MTVVTLTPDGSSSSGTPTLTGAASIHAALNDSSDASYVTLDGADEISLTFGDLTLPAGALLTRLSPVFRDKVASGLHATYYSTLTAGFERGTGVVTATWTTYADHAVAPYSAAFLGDITDSNVDGASVLVEMSGGNSVAVAKISLQVTYVVTPVTSVTTPTGTVSDTNTPSVTWSNTLDTDGGAQAKHEVKIFSAAQYGAGGFDPDSSTPTETSGITTGTATSWAPSDPLPNDDYRAYVRVAQSVLGSDHWSDWDYEAFTVTANSPGVPTITAVAEDDEGRIWITLDDTLGATTHAFEVQRSIDAGSTWETIRTTDAGLITPASGVGRAYDHEVGNGVTVRYRARAVNIITEFTTYSAWSSSTTPTAWQSTSWWLKSPLHPDLNIAVEIGGMDSINQAANQGVFDVLGRRLPVVVSDIRSGYRGTVRFVFDDQDERDEFDDLLDLLEPLLLQAPPTDHWTDRYMMLGNLSSARGFDKSFVEWTVATLQWIEVEEPTGDIIEWPAFGS